MPSEPRTYLWDARRAAEQVAAFVEGRSWDEYRSDAMLRSPVEIVAFRNVLIHGYAGIDNRLVWSMAAEKLAPLNDALGALLADQMASTSPREVGTCSGMPSRRRSRRCTAIDDRWLGRLAQPLNGHII